MAGFSLSNDNSMIGFIREGKLILSVSNYKNPITRTTLYENVKKMVKVVSSKNKTLHTVMLDGVPIVTVTNRNTIVERHTGLSAFETRLMGQSRGPTGIVPFKTRHTDIQLETDLHSHFAGAISPQALIKCGLGKGIMYKKQDLLKAGVDVDRIQFNENEQVLLDNLVARISPVAQQFENALKMDTSEQETFGKMEEIYAFRGPITKHPDTFIDIIREIAKECQQNGTKYIELSLSTFIEPRNVWQLELLNKHMPEIEQETGVKVRFLGAMWRHSDPEWNDDMTDLLKVVAGSPYVVGCDFMGHEINQTNDFADNIKSLAQYAMKNDPYFVIRVHAGENPLFKKNVREVLVAVIETRDALISKAKEDLLQETGIEYSYEELEKHYPFPQVRLGHGIYGFDEGAGENEGESTKNLSVLELCKKVNPIIEFNMSSNLSLNNINNLDIIPIKKYIDNGIRVVLGTDGSGLYSTSINEEIILAFQAGLTREDVFKIKDVESQVMANADKRFESKKDFTTEGLKEKMNACFSTETGTKRYTDEVWKKYTDKASEIQNDLMKVMKESGAITDIRRIRKATRDKKPIMITGSSKAHFDKISDYNKKRIKAVLYVLSRVVDPTKTYFITGGTNYGVEKEAHEIFNELNKKEDRPKTVVLGMFTQAAANPEKHNNVEPNTITHAMVAEYELGVGNDGKLRTRQAKEWYDLPDVMIGKVFAEQGSVVAIAGGGVVSDMIQRSHNISANLNIMENVEGASGDKAVSLRGHGHNFYESFGLINNLRSQIPDCIDPTLTNEQIADIIAEAEFKYNIDKIWISDQHQ